MSAEVQAWRGFAGVLGAASGAEVVPKRRNAEKPSRDRVSPTLAPCLAPTKCALRGLKPPQPKAFAEKQPFLFCR